MVATAEELSDDVSTSERSTRSPSRKSSDARAKSVHSVIRKSSTCPKEKKVVSFADSMGLDLCCVRPIFPYNSSDEDMYSSNGSIQSIPILKSNARPLPPVPSNFNCPRYLFLKSNSYPLWKNPITVQLDLVEKAKRKNVCLKSSNVIGMTLSGVVSVNNISFGKQVHVRYSLDAWRSFVDVPAQYQSSNRQDNLDYFSFSIYLPNEFPVGAICEFCIRYKCDAGEFWDNNDGSNYVLEVRTMAQSSASTALVEKSPVFY